MLSAKLERHLARPHTLPYEVSAFIYIYIYIDFKRMDKNMVVTYGYNFTKFLFIRWEFW